MADSNTSPESLPPPIPQPTKPLPFWVGPVKLILQIVRVVVVVGVVVIGKLAIRQGGLPVALSILAGVVALALISWLISRGITMLATDASREKPSRALAVFKLIVGVPLVVVALLGLNPEWPVGLLPAGYMGPLVALGFALLVAIGLHLSVMGAFAFTGGRPPVWMRSVLFLAVLGIGAGLGPSASESYRGYQGSLGKIPLFDSGFGDIDYVSFAPGDKGVYLVDDYGRIELWDLENPRAERATVGPGYAGSSFSSVRFSPNRQFLAWSRSSSSSGVINLAESKDAIQFENSSGSVAFDYEGKSLARANSGVLSSAIEIWDIPSASKRQSFEVDANRKLLSLAFHPDGKRLYSSFDDASIVVWDLANGSSKPFTKLSGSIYRLTVSPDGKLLAASGHDLGIMILDADGGQQVTHFTTHNKLVYQVLFTSDSRHVFSIGGVLDMVVYGWDARSGNIFFRRPIGGHRDALDLSSDDKRLATSGDYHSYVWDISGVLPPK